MYLLWRRGVRVADSLLISTVNFAATLLFFLLSSLIALLWIPPDLFGEDFTAFFQTSFGLISGIITAIFLVLFFPKGAHIVLDKLLHLLPLRSVRLKHAREQLLARIDAETQRFGSGFRGMLQQNKTGLVLTVFATLALFFNKYLIGYFIARALGQEVPFDIFIGLQVIQLMLIYFAPTPGAAGVAELSSVWLMGKLMPEPMLMVYAVCWRFCTTILAAILGGIVLLREK
ncbi:MAG: flippase-like domain-containing protein [Lewinellaceae bacterium]|nr:flippase-like domain-containing protein [Lewinellaceae bacterium]